MANAMVPLANLTLSSAQATVTFSSIPGTYRDLRLVINGQTTGALNNAQVQFNADGGSNYTAVRMLGDGSSASSSAPGALTFMQFGDIGNIDTVITGDVMDYSATDKHKTALIRGSNAGGVVSAYAGRWANTAAITSLKVTGANTFASGTTFALYGIAS